MATMCSENAPLSVGWTSFLYWLAHFFLPRLNLCHEPPIVQFSTDREFQPFEFCLFFFLFAGAKTKSFERDIRILSVDGRYRRPRLFDKFQKHSERFGGMEIGGFLCAERGVKNPGSAGIKRS